MTVEHAGVGAGSAENLLVEVAELGVDGGKRSYRVTFAEREDVLAATGRIFDVQIEKSSIEERDEWDGGGEGAAGVKSVVHCIATLLQRKDANVRVLDGKESKDAKTDMMILMEKEGEIDAGAGRRQCLGHAGVRSLVKEYGSGYCAYRAIAIA
jgi:hypothetical protein